MFQRASILFILLLSVTLTMSACDDSGKDNSSDQVSTPNEPDPVPTPAASGIWLAGDGHVHSDHSSDGSLTRQTTDDRGIGTLAVDAQIAFAEFTGLDWMPFTDHRTFDQHWDPLWESDQIILITGEEANGSPHCTVFGAIDTAIQGSEPENAPGFRNLQQSIWDVQSQGALWNIAHADRRTYDAATDSVTPFGSQVGQANAEVWNRGENPEAEVDYVENRWNAGWRFGILGASDNHSRLLWGTTGPGSPTTFVFAADESERGILSGLQHGRTVVSSGQSGPFPTITADLDGDGVYEGMVGSELLTEPGTTGTIRVTVERAAGLQVLVYKNPGRDAGPWMEFIPDTDSFVLEQEFEIGEEHSWFRVEVRGPGQQSGREAQNDLTDQILALTSGLFVSGTGTFAEPNAEIPVPDSEQTDDGAITVMGENDQRAAFGDVAQGGIWTHVVGEVRTQTATRVLYRRQAEDGELSEALNLAPESATARYPRVAALNNNVWVVWEDERASQAPHRPAIYMRHSPDGGQTWQTATRISNGERRSEHPDIAVTPDGHAVIVWHDNSGTGAFDVLAQVIGIDQSPINLSGEDKTIIEPAGLASLDSRSSIHPASLFPTVAARDDGTLAVVWHDNRTDPDPLWTGAFGTGEGTDPDNWEVLASVRPFGENWSAPINVSNTPDLADWHASAMFAPDGDLLIAWDAKELSSSGRDLFIRGNRLTLDDGGASAGEPMSVTSVDTPGMSRRPIFGTAKDGRILLAWSDSRNADWRWRVFAAELTADGYAEPQAISGVGNATFPQMADGRLIFTGDRNAARVQRDRKWQLFMREVE